MFYCIFVFSTVKAILGILSEALITHTDLLNDGFSSGLPYYSLIILAGIGVITCDCCGLSTVSTGKNVNSKFETGYDIQAQKRVEAKRPM